VKITPHQKVTPPSRFCALLKISPIPKHFATPHPDNWKLPSPPTYSQTDWRIALRRTTKPHSIITPNTYPKWIPALPRAGPASLVSLPSQFLRFGFCLPRGSERNCRHPRPPPRGLPPETFPHDPEHRDTGCLGQGASGVISQDLCLGRGA
jgi:hypothetical protein